MTLTKSNVHPMDSVEYWRERAEQYKNLYESEREAHDDFRASSKELETELEQELAGSQATINSLTTEKRRLATEVERLQESQRQERAEFVANENRLTAEVQQLRGRVTEMADKIRQLENENDKLEQHNRIKGQMVLDLTEKYEEVLDRLGIVEAMNMAATEEEIDLPTSADTSTEEARAARAAPRTDYEPPRRLVYHATTQTDEFWLRQVNGTGAGEETAYRRVPNSVAPPKDRPAPQQNGTDLAPHRNGANGTLCSTRLVQELLHKIEDFEKRLRVNQASSSSSKTRKNGEFRFTQRH